MERICKNCVNFEIDKKESKNDFNIGPCKKEAYDVLNMKSNQMAIICAHDGPVYVGENFGCIHFKPNN